jgi:hypothetical protein
MGAAEMPADVKAMTQRRRGSRGELARMALATRSLPATAFGTLLFQQARMIFSKAFCTLAH